MNKRQADMESLCGESVNRNLTVNLVAVAPGLVPIAGLILLPTCPGILWTFTWSWGSYGGAQYGR